MLGKSVWGTITVWRNRGKSMKIVRHIAATRRCSERHQFDYRETRLERLKTSLFASSLIPALTNAATASHSRRAGVESQAEIEGLPGGA
jgi:hypothetical protein